MHRTVAWERLAGQIGTLQGLTTQEAARRRARYGSNTILEAPPHPWRDLLLQTLRDPMIWFLAVTGGVYVGLGSTTEAVTLWAAIIPLVAMDVYLHRRTRASTEGLASQLSPRVTAIRDGHDVNLPAEALVPGDLVRVGTGENFPADGMVLGGSNLQADESSLTGEAFPVRKHVFTGAVPSDVKPESWGLAGTRLLTGQALLRVLYTGSETLFGEIARAALRGTHAATPLQQSVGQLVALLMAAAAFLCGILAYVRVAQGYGWLDALINAATLAVAALPEEFPVVSTTFLGVGVYRLARRQALVRRAVSVENIGRVTSICSDKTGTITEGRLRLARVLSATAGGDTSLLVAAAMASRRESGDPLDVAILDSVEDAPTLGVETLATFPFTEDRRRETAVLRAGNGALQAVTKGTPELILELCAPAPGALAHWQGELARLAAEAFKVIGVASRPLDVWPGGEPDRGFTLLGLLAFTDPIRKGVTEAVQQCREAGIHVVLVTGDHPETARAVARQAGLGTDTCALITGDGLDAFLARGDDPRQLDVIARALPAQKLTLVKALQERGELVAVTGDGVNDVPALQAADVGIGMGGRGTRSAREASSIILLDDNFRTIVFAIAEGRQLFRNLQSSFQYLLAIHIPLVLTAALVPLLGEPVLYQPIHIIWLEAIVHPTAMLAFQMPSHDTDLRRAWRLPQRRFFTRAQWLGVMASGLVFTAVVMASYHHGLTESGSSVHPRTMAVALLSLASVCITFMLGGLRTRAGRTVALLTTMLCVLFIQTPAIASVLNLEPLHADDWLMVTASAAAGALVLRLPTLVPTARVRRALPSFSGTFRKTQDGAGFAPTAQRRPAQ